MDVSTENDGHSPLLVACKRGTFPNMDWVGPRRTGTWWWCWWWWWKSLTVAAAVVVAALPLSNDATGEGRQWGANK